MSSQLYNNVSDALLNSIDNVQTSFDIVSGNVPLVDAGDYIPIHVIRSSDNAFEIMHVTGVSGSTLTVTRAAEATSPLTFPSGEKIQIRPTRQSLAEIDVSDSEVTTNNGTDTLSATLNNLDASITESSEGVVFADDYSGIRALDDDNDVVIVKGRDSPGDGGSGIFYRDSTDDSSSDNDATVMVATGLYRWKRSYNGTLDARWFGAKGDGSTDDQAAIQTALNEAESKTRGGKVWLPSPSDAYLISDGLIVPMNVHLIGGTDRTHIRADAATFPVGKYMIQMGRDNGPDFGVGIQGLHLDCNGVDDSRGVEIPALQENSFLKEITVTNCQWNCIRVYNGVNASPQNFLMQGLWLILDPSITESGSRHINIQGAGGPILIQRLSTVFKNVTPGTVPGVSVDLNAQVTIDTWNAEAGLDGASFNARVSSNLASIRNMRSRGDNTGIQVQSGAVGGVFQNIISPDQSTGITIDDNINTVDVTGAVTHYAT